MVKYAEQRIREATRRLEAIDRELADLPLAVRGLPHDHPVVQQARIEAQALGAERNKAFRELLELLELDETPIDQMGHA